MNLKLRGQQFSLITEIWFLQQGFRVWVFDETRLLQRLIRANEPSGAPHKSPSPSPWISQYPTDTTSHVFRSQDPKHHPGCQTEGDHFYHFEFDPDLPRAEKWRSHGITILPNPGISYSSRLDLSSSFFTAFGRRNMSTKTLERFLFPERPRNIATTPSSGASFILGVTAPSVIYRS
jgi:hypothetical protein